MAKDAFPTRTQQTWIGQQLLLGDAGRREVNRHVMSVYSNGLATYYRGSSYYRIDRGRLLGDPDEVVQGFYADRLGRDDFLIDWQSRGMPLRRWLMNGLLFYVQERLRKEKRHDGSREFPEELVGAEAEPSREVERRFAIDFIQEACRRTEAECRARDQEAHWEAFRLRHLEGLKPRQIAPRLEVDARQVMGLVRTAKDRFHCELRSLMAREVAAENVDEELRLLIDSMDSES